MASPIALAGGRGLAAGPTAAGDPARGRPESSPRPANPYPRPANSTLTRPKIRRFSEIHPRVVIKRMRPHEVARIPATRVLTRLDCPRSSSIGPRESPIGVIRPPRESRRRTRAIAFLLITTPRRISAKLAKPRVAKPRVPRPRPRGRVRTRCRSATFSEIPTPAVLAKIGLRRGALEPSLSAPFGPIRSPRGRFRGDPWLRGPRWPPQRRKPLRTTAPIGISEKPGRKWPRRPGPEGSRHHGRRTTAATHGRGGHGRRRHWASGRDRRHGRRIGPGAAAAPGRGGRSGRTTKAAPATRPRASPGWPQSEPRSSAERARSAAVTPRREPLASSREPATNPERSTRPGLAARSPTRAWPASNPHPQCRRTSAAAPPPIARLGALARVLRPHRRFPAPPEHPLRRHARDRRAADRHRAAGAGHDAGPRRRPVRQARRRDDQADQAGPARPRDARRDRRDPPAHRGRLRRLRGPRPPARGRPRGLRDAPGRGHRRRLPGGEPGPDADAAQVAAREPGRSRRGGRDHPPRARSRATPSTRTCAAARASSRPRTCIRASRPSCAKPSA